MGSLHAWIAYIGSSDGQQSQQQSKYNVTCGACHHVHHNGVLLSATIHFPLTSHRAFGWGLLKVILLHLCSSTHSHGTVEHATVVFFFIDRLGPYRMLRRL